MQQTLSDVIGSIYDSVADDEMWPRALDLVGRQVDGFLTTLAVFDTVANSARLAQVACDNPEAVRVLMRHAKSVPFYHLLHLIEIDQPGSLERMFALYGPDGETVWKRGELYHHFHSQFGVLNSIDMAVLKRPSRIGTINISVKYQQVSQKQFDVIALLGPHIRRAVTIRDLFEMERAEKQIFKDVVDRLEHGVVVVSSSMDILYANPAAELFLRGEALVFASGGRLAARLQPAQAALARAISIGVKDEVDLGPFGIDIPLGVTRQPAVAHVLPLSRRSLPDRIERRAAAAIFIAAAGTLVQTAIEAIAALFGLTAAEKRVANQVSDGMSRHEIAEAQGVTDGTVKSQLAAIFDKTGTSDQRSLQSLMKELTPPVRRT